MRYKIGIMSETWEVDAPNVDVAVVALRMWGSYPTIPIVNYTGDEQSKFMNLMGSTDETTDILKEFINTNLPDIKNVIKQLNAPQPDTQGQSPEALQGSQS